MAIAWEEAGLLGSALRAATAAVQADALREVMKTLEQPAWRRLKLFGQYIICMKDWGFLLEDGP
jgi:hypothetical protein